MTATEWIRRSLETSQGWLRSLLEDVKEAPLTFPTSKGGNHPLWILGHVVHSEASMVAGFILGQENPLGRWDALFGRGSVPEADKSKYPGMDDLVAEWKRVRARTLEVLGSFNDADLSKPSKAPPALSPMFGTVGQCFSMISHHTAFHAGQVADARRALGRKPVLS